MSSSRQKIIGWSLALVGVLTMVFSQQIVFPSLMRLLSTETIAGSENVIYHSDGSYVFTNPGAIVRRISPDKAVTFSSLPMTDTLEVRFSSRGCFHFYTYDFSFRHGATSMVSVVSVGHEWSEEEKEYVEMSRENLGQVQLTESHLMRLDELLRFYRSQPHGSCTTVDTITLTQARDGKILGREQFIDG
jgi:hypothetical protein